MDTSGNIMESPGIINITNISQLETFMNDYNENIRYYNRNFRDMLELYRGMINDERERRVERQRRFNANHNNTNRMNWNTNWNTNWNNNWYRNANIINNDLIHRYIPSVGTQLNNLRDQFNNLQDVIVRPTNHQIQTATQVIHYDISMEQQNCPISLEPFEQDESISIIKHCRHIFKSSYLMNWFERNVRCPVCRYDIREYREEQEYEEHEDQEEEEEEEEEEQGQRQRQRLEEEEKEQEHVRQSRNNSSNNLISTLVRNLITDEMNRTPNLNNTLNDFLVTFNIPLVLDISYNETY